MSRAVRVVRAYATALLGVDRLVSAVGMFCCGVADSVGGGAYVFELAAEWEPQVGRRVEVFARIGGDSVLAEQYVAEGLGI
jgi:hypothetical protein